MKQTASLIICTKDRPEDLTRALSALLPQAHALESVIIVDGSTSANTQILCSTLSQRDWRELLIYIKADRPGLTHQRNIGIAAVSSDLVLFVDDDVEVLPGYVDRMCYVLATEPHVVGVGGNQVNVTPPSDRSSDASLEAGTVNASGRAVGAYQITHDTDVDWLPGCSMGFRRTLLAELKFDEGLPGYGNGEDVDFTYRARMRGTLRLLAEARLVHNQSPVNRHGLGVLTRDELVNRYRRVRTGIGVYSVPAFWASVSSDVAADLNGMMRGRRSAALHLFGLLLGCRDIALTPRLLRQHRRLGPRIAMIGPGVMPIPTDGWGAIETVIWELSQELEDAGAHVAIVNTPSKWRQLLHAKPWAVDAVHVHYEPHLRLWLSLRKLFRYRLIATSHSPMFGQAHAAAARQAFSLLVRVPEMFALDAAGAEQYVAANPSGAVRVIPNGVRAAAFKFSEEGNGRALCLGRIEPRKNQDALWRMIRQEPTFGCDFVGPVSDLVRFPPPGLDAEHLAYLGEWTRDQVRERLGQYSVLLLASDHEAHSLVTLEAQAAGVPVVATPGAASHLDRSKPWIAVADFGVDFLRAATRLASAGPEVRSAERRYAESHLDWSSIARLYLDALSTPEQA